MGEDGRPLGVRIGHLVSFHPLGGRGSSYGDRAAPSDEEFSVIALEGLSGSAFVRHCSRSIAAVEFEKIVYAIPVILIAR